MYEKLLQIILEANKNKNDDFGAGVHDDKDKFGAGLDDEPAKPKPAKPRPAPAPAPSSPTPAPAPTPEPSKPKPVSKKKFGLSQPARERIKDLLVRGGKGAGKLALKTALLPVRGPKPKTGVGKLTLGAFNRMKRVLGPAALKAIKKSVELGQ